MAHKKSGGSTSNVRDSNPQRLGVKAFGGERVSTGDIIVRQRGTRFFAGRNTFIAKDDTIHAAVAGTVKFAKVKKLGYDGHLRRRTRVEVEPAPAGTPPKPKKAYKPKARS
ncbi:MAG: 50S ribosomal protein L27 [Candidatus Andersenbacteria bacterium]